MITFQIKNRFLGLRKVLDLFLFLTSKIILTLTDTELRNKTILLLIHLLLCEETLRFEVEKIKTLKEFCRIIRSKIV